MRRLWRLYLLCVTVLVGGTSAAAQNTSCITCHGDSDLFPAERVQIVLDFQKDVHSSVGLSCQDCHGGNPSSEVAEDMVSAMDPHYRENPYRGAPDRLDIPQFCGRCHSDPDYMRRFGPDIRIDQEREYRTSQHGIALRTGDSKVATCIDCHSVHGIARVDNTTSPVFPKNVATTCAKCHSDQEYMAGYNLPDGRPIPINQFALWKVSVHAKAMMEKEDLSAPTCNDCHGNHGANPPGLESISFVCGQCHGREASLFRASAKHDGFQMHNSYLESADGNCEMCHELPSDFAELPPIRSFSECASCHGNHSVVRPTVGMLSPLPPEPCKFCHEAELSAAEAKAVLSDSEAYREVKGKLMAAAQAGGYEGSELFDWLVDQALQLPNHSLGVDEQGKAVLRPEFSRLYEKFRLGKTSFEYEDPSDGVQERKLIHCGSCHNVGEDASAAGQLAKTYLNRLSELSSLTATAERLLLRARRGGVETRGALQEIDQAVDSQIELQVLIHSFSSEHHEAFLSKADEGVGFATKALASAEQALGELSFRRTGLGISLIFIFFVLLGLGLKIRQIG